MKCERLKKRTQFVHLQKNAKSRVLPAFVLLYEATDHSAMRFGFTASKRIGNAVQRNRARRRLRAVVDAVVRLNPDFQLDQNVDCVLIAKHSTLTRDFKKMCADLDKVLKTCLKNHHD